MICGLIAGMTSLRFAGDWKITTSNERVEEWYQRHCRNVKADSAAHALAHVRRFFPEGVPCPASRVTPMWLGQRLYDYTGKRNTLRKVHSSISVFLDYCTRPVGIFAENPMNLVDRPTLERSPIRFYDLDTVERITGAQESEARRVFFTLAYGTAIEVSTALRLTRADVMTEAREIRAAGTKAYSRDRMCRVAGWAWPALEAYCKHMLPTARLFPIAWTRWTVSDWHRQTVIRLGLAIYPLHCARDHWAVRALRASAPVAVVQQQLGHSSPMLTLTKYGRFIPTAADRNEWERRATEQDERIRAAK